MTLELEFSLVVQVMVAVVKVTSATSTSEIVGAVVSGAPAEMETFKFPVQVVAKNTMPSSDPCTDHSSGPRASPVLMLTTKSLPPPGIREEPVKVISEPLSLAVQPAELPPVIVKFAFGLAIWIKLRVFSGSSLVIAKVSEVEIFGKTLDSLTSAPHAEIIAWAGEATPKNITRKQITLITIKNRGILFIIAHFVRKANKRD